MVGHQAASTLLNKTGTAKTAHGRKLIAKGPGNAGRGSAWTGHMNAGESAGRDYVGPLEPHVSPAASSLGSR